MECRYEKPVKLEGARCLCRMSYRKSHSRIIFSRRSVGCKYLVQIAQLQALIFGYHELFSELLEEGNP